jgi:hypothetical protein
MKKLYQCQVTGKIFDNPLDCRVSEYMNGEERQKFIELFHQFLDTIEKKYNLVVHRDTLKLLDELENYYNDRNIHYRYVKFEFTINGKKKTYERTSNPVGDGRWEWGLEDNLESLVEAFENEFILPLRKKFVGKLKEIYDYDRREMYWTLDNKRLDYILRALLKRKAKKIKIEVIE